MSILTQVMVAERYGLRLDVAQLAALLGITPKTVYNQVSAGTFPIKTYVDGGQRWADYRDAAAHFDALREKAA